MKKIKRIIAYGCSYTAGDELMDHEAIGVSFEECNQLKQKYIVDKEKRLDKNHLFKVDYNIPHNDPMYRNSVWAGQIAKQLNIDFENRAINGSGIDEHYFNLYHDYIRGNIENTDLVLIGLTSLNRIIDFRLDKPEEFRHSNTLLLGRVPDNIGSKLLLELYTDDVLVFNYFKTIHLIHTLSSKINLLMQPMRKAWTIHHINDLDISQTREYANSTWNECSSSVLSELYLEDVGPPCAFGHPSVESHIHLASQLAEVISNKFKIS